MGLLDKLLHRKKAEVVPEYKPINISFVKPKRKTFKESNPDDISMDILKTIDYEQFGIALKQNKLLPPSYDRKPEEIDFYTGDNGVARVKLIFKSQKSKAYRVVVIRGYNVSYGVNCPYSYERSKKMSKEWEDFVERSYFVQQNGYPSFLVNDDRIKKLMEEENKGL